MAEIDNSYYSLTSISTVGQLSALLDNPEFVAYISGLSKIEAEALLKAAKDLKLRLNPMVFDENYIDLQSRLESLKKQNASTDDIRKALEYVVARHAELKASYSFKEYDRVVCRLDRMVNEATSHHFASHFGISNRAKRTRTCFNVHAGMTKFDKSVKADKHGNADGTDFDLGADGAFNGQNVVILQEYGSDCVFESYCDGTTSFNMKEPINAMQTKGFVVDRIINTTNSDAESLRLKLTDPKKTQFWLISGRSEILSAGALDVIAEFWRRGGAVCIYGDNEPFYVDANRLASKLLDIKMTGNTFGDQTVSEIGTTGGGFYPHFITTGITRLYPGVTIATFNSSAIQKAGCKPLVHEHSGNLTCIYREPQDGCGALVINGGFTQLFCHWDQAASARFVKNIVCWLASFSFPGVVEQNDQNDEKVKTLDFKDSLQGSCDVMATEGTLNCSFSEMASADSNTSDFVLDDPMGQGIAHQNRLLLSQIAYGSDFAAYLITSDAPDPLTRGQVAGTIPCVNLSISDNKEIVGISLCQLLMGGKHFPTTAYLIFFSMCDQMMTRDPDHPEMWSFFMNQILHNIKVAPDLTTTSDKQIPLIEAMLNFFTALPELDMIRKSFHTTSLISRMLVKHEKMCPSDVQQIMRKALIKTVIEDCISMAKNTSWYAVKTAIYSLIYRVSLGIPIIGTGHSVELENIAPLMKHHEITLANLDSTRT
jgi:hypothetical protein